MKNVLWIFIMFLFFPVCVHAAVDGNELLQKCGPIEKLYSAPDSLNSKEASGVVYCLGYLDSFIETFQFQVKAKIVPSVPYCMPDEKVPKKEIAKVIVEYLKQHQEELNKPAGYHIFMGLREAYPCNIEDEKENVPEKPVSSDT